MNVSADKTQQLDASTKTVLTAVGDIFERVGLKSIQGKIWCALYLSKKSLSVRELRAQLGVSTGTLSMGLNELIEMGLVHRDGTISGRQFHYFAETEMWHLVTRVFRDRERERIVTPIERIKLAEKRMAAQVESNPELAFRLERVRHLVGLGSFVVDLLDAFMERTKVEVKAAQKWLSVSGRLGGEPLSRLRKRINAARGEKS